MGAGRAATGHYIQGYPNALRFELDLEKNLLRLERELKTRSYRPARSVCFAVSKPKLREIFAAEFRDRVVHHILVDYLEKVFEPKFIFDSYACRAGKGTHRAMKRLQTFARRATANGTRPAYYLQLDVKSYFVSIDKGILLDLIRHEVSDPEALWLAEVVINHDCAADFVLKGRRGLLALLPPHKTLLKAPPGRGLPIGIKFNHRLLPRVLLRAYPGGNREWAAGGIPAEKRQQGALATPPGPPFCYHIHREAS